MSATTLLQGLLEAEHAAVFGYGVLGARLDDVQREMARAAYDAHRARRDDLAVRLRDRRERVPAAQASYDVSVADVPAAQALAVRLEEGLAVRWRDLVVGTDEPPMRALGVDGLVGSAVRAAQWRRTAGLPPTVALPGTA